MKPLFNQTIKNYQLVRPQLSSDTSLTPYKGLIAIPKNIQLKNLKVGELNHYQDFTKSFELELEQLEKNKTEFWGTSLEHFKSTFIARWRKFADKRRDKYSRLEFIRIEAENLCIQNLPSFIIWLPESITKSLLKEIKLKREFLKDKSLQIGYKLEFERVKMSKNSLKK